MVVFEVELGEDGSVAYLDVNQTALGYPTGSYSLFRFADGRLSSAEILFDAWQPVPGSARPTLSRDEALAIWERYVIEAASDDEMQGLLEMWRKLGPPRDPRLEYASLRDEPDDRSDLVRPIWKLWPQVLETRWIPYINASTGEVILHGC